MKSIILILLFISAGSYGQNKERIIFMFESDKDVVEVKNGNEFYNLNKQFSFKYDIKRHNKANTDYNKVKDDFKTYNEFVKLNKGKKFPEYFDGYTFFIFINKNDDEKGCLVEVEKIWLIDQKIIN